MKHLLIILLSCLLLNPCFGGVDFDGSDDRIDIGDVELVTKNFSISLWFNADDLTNNNSYIISKYETVTGGRAYAIFFDTPSNEIKLLLGTSGGDVFTNAIVSNMRTILSDDTWYNMIWTRNGADASLYIDGVSQTISGNTLVDENIPNVTTGIKIGSRTGSRYFDGTVTDVAIWNVALGQTEVNLIALSKVKNMPLQLANLVGYWPLDDEEDGSSADGDNFLDMSGNGNDGTGNDGGNNTGLIAKAEEVLSYP